MAKITQVMALTSAIATLSALDNFDTEVVTKLTEMKEALEKKSASKKPTKTQTENEGYLAEIMNVLSANGSPMTIKQICGASDILADFSTSKMSALLKKAVDNGTVVKSYEKKQAYFTAC